MEKIWHLLYNFLMCFMWEDKHGGNKNPKVVLIMSPAMSISSQFIVIRNTGAVWAIIGLL